MEQGAEAGPDEATDAAQHAHTTQIAPKVKWGAVASAVAGIILTAVPGLLSNRYIVQGVLDWITAIVLGVLTGGVASYQAKHQRRQGDDTTDTGLVGVGPLDHAPQHALPEDYDQGERL